jgi:hypothetical protein
MKDVFTQYGIAGIVFQFALLTLAAYQLSYVVTTSSWPPVRWFHIKLRDTYGTADKSAMSDFWTCPNCVSFWLTVAVFSWAGYLLNVPLVVLQAVAAARIVGTVGSRLD